MEQLKGTVFSIERFSIHDGDGVRTSVFLKGCGLSCVWCHNPESHNLKEEIKFIDDVCLYCKECEEICENGAHKFELENLHTVDRKNCVLCKKCVSNCLVDALEVVGKEMTIEEVMKEVRKDKIYYKDIGGITLSGGEPLLQIEFVKGILKKCREENITTCIETCGDVPKNNFVEIMDCVDNYLFDYKLSNAELMKKYTNGNYYRVMENLDFLIKNKKRVTLRCPIIPTINDNDLHFKEIAKVIVKYNISKYELMPYHDLGESKWGNMGKNYILDIKSASDDEAKMWNEKLNNFIESEKMAKE